MNTPITYQQALQFATQKLTNNEVARLEGEILLSHILKKDRIDIYRWPQRLLTNQQQQQFKQLILRRQAGEPIAYLTGQKAFWSLNLTVGPQVLIPRPETELLVEQALHCLPPSKPCQILDLGTGSGAIALAIAQERPHWQITATDISKEALKIAKENAFRHRLQQILFIQSDWFTQLPPLKFDLIISNPPYIAIDDPHLTQGDIQHEPPQALISGREGLTAIQQIIIQAMNFLKPKAFLWLEHGYNQQMAVQKLLHHHGYRQIETLVDYSGIPRISGGVK